MIELAALAPCYLCRKRFLNGDMLVTSKLGIRHKRCPGLPKQLSEKHIEETCSDWLALDGWRTLKTDPVSDRSRGKGFGELGMADRLYIRYGSHGRLCHCVYPGGCCGASVLWIEWKRKTGKAQQNQLDWIAAERARGGLVWLAGADFPAVIEEFQAFYRKSGLLRNGSL